MNNNLIAFADNIAEGIATRRKQISVFGRVLRSEFDLVIQQLVGEATRFRVGEITIEFITPAERKLPGIIRCSAVAVGAFNFDIGQQGTGDVTVAMHGGG